MKKILFIISVFVLVVGILVSCSSANKSIALNISSQNINSVEQELTTVFVDENDVTHFYMIVPSTNKFNNESTTLIEIVTDKKGNPVKDNKGYYITSSSQITINSISASDRIKQNKTTNSITTKKAGSIDDNNLSFESHINTTSNKKENYSKNDNYFKDSTIRIESSTKKENISETTFSEESEPSEPITDSEGWINKWY